MIKNGQPYSCESNIKHATPDDALITELEPELQKLVISWIRWNIFDQKKVNHRYTSYGLKHDLAEDLDGLYLTNNQFKDAMLKAGYAPVDPDVLNWEYRIRVRKRDAKKRFNLFCRRFEDDPSILGSFVRERVYSPSFPKACFPFEINHDTIKAYLNKNNATEMELAAFESLWCEYGRWFLDAGK